MLFTETPVDCHNMKHMNTLRDETAEPLGVTAGGIYSCHCALNGYGLTFTAILKH
jgi:hypothetical protein